MGLGLCNPRGQEVKLGKYAHRLKGFPPHAHERPGPHKDRQLTYLY